MRTLKIIMMYLILVFALITCREVGLTYDKSDNDSDVFESPVNVNEPILAAKFVDCFEYAESVTGFSAEVLRGIAATESHFRTRAIGDDSMSFGMFQLYSRWYESRAKKWGEFDPTDPFESAVIAGRIMRENLLAFDGDLRLAISAYKQGIAGVKEQGAIQWYVDDVLNWRNDPEKMLSLFLFCGITDIGALYDEYKGTGTQNTYKLDDFLAIQISWRRSGGISQE